MMASPLIFNDRLQMPGTNYGHFRNMSNGSEAPSSTGQSTSFHLDSMSQYDQENAHENISSTDQSSVAGSTVATTMSEGARSQNQESNCQTTIGTTSVNECTQETSAILSRRDPFRKGICLRKAGTRTEPLYIYPYSYSEMSKDYNDHFDEVSFRLKENVFHASNIDSSLRKDMLYQMLKVGSSPQTVHSAVVAICEEEIYDQVRTVLYEPRLLRDCNLYNPTTAQCTLLSWFKRSSEPDPHRPYMPLYIYAGKPVTSLHQTLNTISENPSYGHAADTQTTYEFTLCGAKVTTANRGGSATIACVLKLDDRWYGLTAAHTFREDSINKLSETNDQSWASVQTKCFVSPGGDASPKESNIYLPSSSLFNTTTADLDWGLISLTDTNLIKENTYISRSSSRNHLTVMGLVKAHPQTERNVLILSSALTPLSGVLLDEYTYRTTVGEGIVQLWSVEVDEGQELVKGHSGSLVVDASTGEAYGYIVALDIFGKAQVVPLHSTLEQIRDLTAVKDVALADRANIQQMETRSQPSPRLLEQHASTECRADYSDPFKTDTAFESQWQEAHRQSPDITLLDGRRIVERLLKIQQCLQNQENQINKTDIEFLSDLTKYMQDHFSMQVSKDQQQFHKPPNTGIYLEQINTSPSEGVDRLKPKDVEKHETVPVQGGTKTPQPTARITSVGEQDPFDSLETPEGTEERAAADPHQPAKISSAKFLKQWLISRRDVTERKSEKKDESINKWAEQLPDANEKPSIFWEMEQSTISDSNKSDDGQASCFDSDDEYYHKHRDDGTSITSFQPRSTGSSRRLSPRHTYSWTTTAIEPFIGIGAASLELPTSTEPILVRPCRICGKLCPGNEQNFSSSMQRHMREQHNTVEGNQCPLCQQVFKRKQALKTHICTVYVGDQARKPQSPLNLLDKEAGPNETIKGKSKLVTTETSPAPIVEVPTHQASMVVDIPQHAQPDISHNSST